MTETHCRLSKTILFQASRYSSESGQGRFKFSQEQAVKLRYLHELEYLGRILQDTGERPLGQTLSHGHEEM